ncbi:cardiolipin synthase [Heyndrickxia ginsengihumi]|uniref:Cardiolipin synthase n=1 Tax=Heyndrickxia ginsengihumi TaxID=363870 RepID=A0A0A6VIH7_9BACI|nr:cardiolipin synthase [Heyndrickxia ginsengihumi]KHD86439.1 phospholipase D [Heyndrickxia ginsengihumi]MBE6184274.1 cardiolipin synthase [Bacillus sp. (in: firmicutes)]NEY19183.1 cardiolipin synthase [Heyndrickxia ginsengihumi]
MILTVLLILFLILNLILLGTVIFLERRDVGATWAWLLVLSFLPVVGFILYLILGQNLSRRKIFDWKVQEKVGIKEISEYQISLLKNNSFPFHDERTIQYKDLIYMLLMNDGAILSQDNHVDIFTDGKEKFQALFEDIRNAKDSIHLVYYIIRNDQLGKSLVELLTMKAKEGVKVRVLYDDMGSRTLPRKFFKSLIEAGGEAAAFFPAKIPLFNLRVNFRNHRKLAIIDGQIGYIGGFNIGDEYLGLNKRFGYWRDTHLRIIGRAVYGMQTRFIMDWNQASVHDIHNAKHYFPVIPPKGETDIQIISSGPDSQSEQIKNSYIKMINSAKKYIYMQSPYFIPDDSLLNALKIAALSGVDVHLMIPNKPDHMFVYWATYSNVGQLLKNGVKVYIYENGFIHAKMLVVDGKIASVGTANIDVRSFRLNFEVNALLYDQNLAARLANIFREDMEQSSELTFEAYQQRSSMIRFKESISRLLSPIL